MLEEVDYGYYVAQTPDSHAHHKPYFGGDHKGLSSLQYFQSIHLVRVVNRCFRDPPLVGPHAAKCPQEAKEEAGGHY